MDIDDFEEYGTIESISKQILRNRHLA